MPKFYIEVVLSAEVEGKNEDEAWSKTDDALNLLREFLAVPAIYPPSQQGEE